MAAPHLRVVGEHVLDENGEIVSPEILKLQGDLENLERELRRYRRLLAESDRDREQERQNYPRREDVERVHSYWQRRCNHPRAGLTPDRFDAVQRIMELTEIRVVDGRRRRVPMYELLDFKRAVDGAWFDPAVKTRRNGTVERFDDLALVCRDGAKFESFIARAPK